MVDVLLTLKEIVIENPFAEPEVNVCFFVNNNNNILSVCCRSFVNLYWKQLWKVSRLY